MENKERIKLKIQALLAKTTENGASEAEAISALKKANDLMIEYYIDESELSDPYLGQKCISHSINYTKSGYDTIFFLGSLCRLFDCFHFLNSWRITFFGFENDVKLAVFFYELINKAVIVEVENYKKSGHYHTSKRYTHGRTLIASFIKGFLYRICQKMTQLYQERNSTIESGKGLMIVEKKEKVKHQFAALSINIKSVGINLKAERGAFNQGVTAGEDFHLTQGIEQHKKNETKQLAF